MPIEDVFHISGRGIVVTGSVVRGRLREGDSLEIVGARPTRATVVSGIEMSRKLVPAAAAGDSIGVLLRGVEQQDVEIGQVVSRPGSISARTTFTLDAYILPREDADRWPMTIGDGDELTFWLRKTEVRGSVHLPAGVATLTDDCRAVITVELSKAMAIASGLAIAIRRDGQTIGVGLIIEIGS
jgi:elongation factor Tu